ncbi:TIGR04211 family SH3 domain-containing protein [Marinobacter sp. C2H3]|uniref:TIGR04211 family SH3 domain-containing protein n=1 Tax=Marinobacter sp. C2H3 TaxID=3119003 RepID=UPI00300EDB19
MTPFRLLIALLLIVSGIEAAQARTVWVDDKLYLPVRSGAGTQYRIIENALPSGTALQVLDTGENYTKVRTPKGTEGWVASQYLSDQPIAADRLKRVSSELEDTKKALDEARSQLAKVTDERDQLQSSESSLSDRTADLQQELRHIKDVASNSLNLERRNQELSQENQKLKNDLEVLTAEKERLEASKESDFMLLGAGLVFGGVLLALVIPMLKPTRKADNWA